MNRKTLRVVGLVWGWCGERHWAGCIGADFEQRSILFIVLLMTTHSSISRASSGNIGVDIALVAVFAALIAAMALLPAIPVGPLGVPITLQNLAVYIVALVLGARRAPLAVLLYLVVGLLGLPIFARGGAGVGVLAGPSAGYLLGYIPAALCTGLVAYSVVRKRRVGFSAVLGMFLATCVGLIIITGCGIVGMMLNAHLSFGAAVGAAAIYLPGDLIKGVIASLVAVAVHRAFPRLSLS